jgi:4-hydroxy-tetrahydrodipicolinate reductase
MTRVCVAGITGWTGRAVAAAIDASDDLQLVSGVSRSAAGEERGFGSVAEALAATPADVLVDFTSAEAVKANVHAALDAGVAVVVGSSGLTAADYEEIDAHAHRARVGVIAAGNFSLLAALLVRCATEVARHVGSWEIIDYASAQKPDVPSGTSRELAERLAEVSPPILGRPLQTIHGPVEARGASVGGTQIHSVRLPSFVVSTEIVFGAPGERLVLRHDPNESPEPYVAGTLYAVRAVRDHLGLTRGLDALLA